MKFFSVILLCIVATGAEAANESSRRLLSMPPISRNAFWSQFARQSAERCDRVVRSSYQGQTDDDYDFWSIECADRSAYLIGVEAGAAGATRLIDCSELGAINRKLVARFGEKLSYRVGCFTPLR